MQKHRNAEWSPFRWLKPEWLLGAFILFVFLLGGGARNDLVSLPFLRGVSAVLLVVLVVGCRERIVEARRPLAVIGVVAAFLLFELVPLPHGLWTMFPGRDIIETVDKTAGLGAIARSWAIEPYFAWNALFSLVVPAAALACLALAGDTAGRGLVTLLLVIAAVAAALGILQLVGSSNSITYLYRITNRDSSVGLMANRNHHALLLACAMPLIALWMSHWRGRARSFAGAQITAGLALALLFPLIVLTGSRAGLVLGALGFVAALCLYRMPEYTKSRRDVRTLHFDVRIMWVLMVVALIAASLFAGRATSFDRLAARGEGEIDRLGMFPVLWRMMIDHFPLGMGAGSFVPLFKFYEPDSFLNPSYYNHAHNDFMELLIDHGIFGAAAIAAAGLAWLGGAVSIWRADETERRSFRWRAGATGLWIMLLCAVASIVDYPLRVPSIQVLVMISVFWIIRAMRAAVDIPQSSAD
ncbi:MAG: O-antigen ligase domain-containing protein [Sphingomonadales bacterium]|nr:MAG: O-antigen ligase domain-containing protein [Sphingomonadales bacterium]